MRIFILFLLFFCLMRPIQAFAEEDAFHSTFEKIFSDWTAAFNRKDVAKSCALFAKSVVANYQGVPPKNYNSICAGFKKIFQSPLRYQYSFKLHQVYLEENLAAVRVTWFLRVYEKGRLKSITQDEGIDIFQKNKAGQWQIVNYLSYGKESAIHSKK